MSHNISPQEEPDIPTLLGRNPLVDHRLTVEDLVPGSRYSANYFLKLELGVSEAVAAASLQITPEEISTWYNRGQEDYSSGDPGAEQSPYARFYARTIQAIAKIAAVAEVRVTEDNPERFLQRGSAKKLIGPQWEEPRNLQHVQHNNVQINVQDNSQANVITLEDLPQLLQIAREVGLDGRLLEAPTTAQDDILSNKEELIKNRDDLASPDRPSSQSMMDLNKIIEKGKR